MYLDVVYLKGIVDITLARNATWGHVAHEAPPTSGGPGHDDDHADLAEVTS